MRKSTKVILVIGFVPIVIGIISMPLSLLMGVLGCTAVICRDISHLHWFILFGILYTLPGALIIAGAYHLVVNKLNARDAIVGQDTQSSPDNIPSQIKQVSATKNTVLAIIILVVVFVSIPIVYKKIQDSRSAASMEIFRQQQKECVLFTEQQSDPMICAKTPTSDACIRVITMDPYPIGQKTHHINRDVYDSCIKTKQIKNL